MISIHVVLGSLAFIVGGVTLLAKKGSRLHKRMGKVFFWTMAISALFTLIVSLMPYHISFSMLQISVMTLYFLVGGMRSIALKQSNPALLIDKALAYAVMSISLIILSRWVLLYGNSHPLLIVFTGVAVAFGVVDLWAFTKPMYVKKHWLILHLSKMVAEYTTAVTGFFVAQDILGGYFNWFTPTVICLIYIFFWAIKLNTIQRNIPLFTKRSHFTK